MPRITCKLNLASAIKRNRVFRNMFAEKGFVAVEFAISVVIATSCMPNSLRPLAFLHWREVCTLLFLQATGKRFPSQSAHWRFLARLVLLTGWIALGTPFYPCGVADKETDLQPLLIKLVPRILPCGETELVISFFSASLIQLFASIKFSFTKQPTTLSRIDTSSSEKLNDKLAFRKSPKSTV